MHIIKKDLGKNTNVLSEDKIYKMIGIQKIDSKTHLNKIYEKY